MKRIKQAVDHCEYELDEKETMVLRSLLNHFPFTKSFPARMSKGTHNAESLDREILLNSSMSTHRAGLATAAKRLARESLSEGPANWSLKLKSEDKEMLLQILNDIRFGAWRELGEPEDVQQKPESPAKFQLWNLMNLAGYFEAALISDEI
jgi:hypothetical protein